MAKEELIKQLKHLEEENQNLKDELEYYRYKSMSYDDLVKNHLI